MKKDLIRIKEPQILFGFNQKIEDPRDGLTLFGPIENNIPYGIMNGVVGTKESLAKFQSFIESLQKPISNANTVTRPFFPGFEAVFRSKWNSKKVIFKEVTNEEIGKHLYNEDTHTRTYELVTLFTEKIIEAVENEDAKADVWFVIIPDQIYSYCRPNSSLPKELVEIKRKTKKSTAKKMLNTGMSSLFDIINEENEPFKHDAHFHHQLKARLLHRAIPTQILRESTIDWRNFTKSNGMFLRDFSKIEGHLAWSLSTAAFYKTGGRPWKLADIREGVCYIGLVYKKDERSGNTRNACCAAQMFLDSGDGTVFRGAVGPWYNDSTKEYHLNRAKAKELISIALETYIEKKGVPPKELFIHAKTRFNNEEWVGFSDAVPESTNLVGISINDRKPLKIFRPDSDFPMIRGLAYIQSERSGFLWTKGYVPRLQTSLSMEVPNPLFIEISKGESDIKVVLDDILALTKLNYNACIYGDGVPVTLRFADAIGEILTASPIENTPPLAFKYYI
ncbi:hypothetical protein SAMN05421640_1040 [Ekhidna lutea]|uniref:Piwi domain-containing protein n=1 Tax=Ekhidna lutea TaxID=447679 RepID=A0A239GY79_EKHLU|nr:hypothetical protein [Ekhidna lutea]SNS73503.1 hypothetical protein SAMN05421640_1040 [Ekhidna lutea]